MPEDIALEFPAPEERDKNSPSGRGGSEGSGSGAEAEGGEAEGGEGAEADGDDDDAMYTATTGIPLPSPQATPPIPLPATTSAPPPATQPSSTLSTSTTSTSSPTFVETLFILKTFDDNDAILSFADTTTSWRHTDPFPVIAHTTIQLENAAVASPATTPSESFGSVTQMSDQAGPTSSPTGPGSASQSSGNSPVDGVGPAPPPPKKSHPPIGAIVVVPIVIIVLTIVAFFLWRRKRRARMVSAARVQEMRMRDQEEALPEYTAPANGAMPYIITSSAGGTTTGTGSIGPATSANNDDPNDNSAAPPVILSNTIQSAYMTGLDTSDNMSTTSSSNPHTQSSSTGITTPGNRLSYDARSMISSDEPPPPYRPASVPPISRETSLRHPTAMNNNITQVLAPLSEATRSSYDGTDDYHVADGLRNPFSGGSSRATTSIAEENESINDPFDDQDGVSVMTRSSRNSRHSDALVSPLEERHPALDARLETRCCVSRPESMVV